MHPILSELNPQQRAAVETLEGPVLVIAGAGSGKTRVITARIMYLYEMGVSPYQILAMTFTNKAALEMKSRVAALMGQSTKDLTVTTFHSFCARFLRREINYLDRESSFAIFDTSDQTSVIKRVLREMDLPEKSFPAAMFRNKISYYKNLDDTGTAPEREPERTVFKLYQEALKDQNALDFDDLLLYTVRILETFGECRSRYQQRFRYLMVDEYQDTNTIQAKLIRLLLNEDMNLCVVGDEDQSIYGWRGADIRNILDFDVHYPSTRIFKLEQNYRSTQNILDYANRIIAENQLRKPKKLWTETTGGPPIMIKDHWTGGNEAEYIIQTISRLQRSDGVDLGHFAILFRSNYLSRSLEEMCRRYQIPYQLIGGLKFYDRKEIKDLLAFMRIVVNPRDWTSFVRALSVPPRGIGPKSQDKLYYLFNDGYTLGEMMEVAIRDKVIPKRGLTGLKGFLELYRKLEVAKDELKPVEWMSLLIRELDFVAYLEKTDGDTADSRVDNVDELLESIREYQAQGVETLSQFMDFCALVNDQDEFDENQPKVSLMTVHAAKGLEFDSVFVMGLEDGVFPNQRSITENPNALEEERRLFYVAVTRARKRLYLSYARRRQTYGSTTSNPKSRFLIAPGIPEGPQDGLPFDDEEDPFLGSSWKRPKKKARLGELGAQINDMQSKLRERNVDVDFSSVSGVKPKKKTGALRPGDTVRHKTFGIGTVSGVRGKGDLQQVTVYFPGKGKKTLVARMAKLEKL